MKMAGACLDVIRRGLLSLVDASRKLQSLQVRLTAGENKDGVEYFEPYGQTAHPLPGAELLIGFVGGDRSHGVVFCVADRRYRPTDLEPGEVCMYTDEGDEIRMRRGRVISVLAGAALEVTAPEAILNCSIGVTLNTPKLSVSGDIEAQGQIRDGVGTMSSMRHTYNGHGHPPDAGNAPDNKME